LIFGVNSRFIITDQENNHYAVENPKKFEFKENFDLLERDTLNET
jgi:hypothetical protein